MSTCGSGDAATHTVTFMGFIFRGQMERNIKSNEMRASREMPVHP